MPEQAEQTQTAPAPEQQVAQDSGKAESVTLAQSRLEEMLREAHKKGLEEAQSKFTGKISQQGKKISEYEKQLEVAGMTQEERDRISASESWRAVAVEARIRAEGLPQSSKRVLMAAKTPEDFETSIAELKEDFKGFDAKAFLSERTASAPDPGRRPASEAPMVSETGRGAMGESYRVMLKSGKPMPPAAEIDRMTAQYLQ